MPLQPSAAAAAGTETSNQAGSETAAEAAVFGGFADVLALRDELQQQYSTAPWARVSSSCASTAGSTSVAAMNSLATDADEGAVHPTAAAAAAAEGTGVRTHASPQQQVSAGQQQGLQQQANGTSSSSPADNGSSTSSSSAGAPPTPAAAVSSMTAVLNPAGDPKASKLKLHWLPNLPGRLLPLRLVRFGHPVLVEKVTEEVDVVEQFNPNSRCVGRQGEDCVFV
jgi:hypothetical protein